MDTFSSLKTQATPGIGGDYSLVSGCVGNLDTICLSASKGKIVVVFRGWIFAETEQIVRLDLMLHGTCLTEIPYGIERSDVAEAFRQQQFANRSGYLGVYQIENTHDYYTIVSHNLRFKIFLKSGRSLEGEFNRARKIIPSDLQTNVVQDVISIVQKQQHIPCADTLIITPQLNSTSRRADMDQIVVVLKSQGMSWEIFETTKLDSRSSKLKLAAILSLTRNRFFIIVGVESYSLFEELSGLIVGANIVGRVLYIGDPTLKILLHPAQFAVIPRQNLSHLLHDYLQSCAS